MTDLSNLFDVDIELPTNDFDRGRWGWGRIKQLNGTTRDYPRISTISDQISSGPGLNIWRGRHIALAVAQNPDISAILAGKEYGDKYVDDYIDKVLTRAKTDEPANWGTAEHRFFEPDSPRDFMPEAIRADVESFDSTMERAGIETIETDIMLVNDRLRLCGTADGIYRMPNPCIAYFKNGIMGTSKRVDISGKVIIGDAKTGQNFMPVKWSVQKACYATGVRYDVPTGKRTPIHPDLDTRVGLVIYVQLGTGTTVLKFVDLEVGYALAELCVVLHAQGSKGQRITCDVPEFKE
jgi:hypothetical protein